MTAATVATIVIAAAAASSDVTPAGLVAALQSAAVVLSAAVAVAARWALPASAGRRELDLAYATSRFAILLATLVAAGQYVAVTATAAT